ncbi:MAG TPA: hypothetical protein VGN20_12050 [Mucilaginibacter sp.]|jgi:hypothetical protein
MTTKLIQYEFINSQTSNVIGYHSLPEDLDKKALQEELEKKRAELAITNTLFVGLIYWQDSGSGVR